MKKVAALQLSAGVVGIVFVGTSYIAWRNRKRDKLSNALLSSLTRKLHPDTKGLASESALDARYVDQVLQGISASIVVLKKSTATIYANQIHQAFKPWYLGGDDEEAVYAIFRRLKDKVQVSQVAKAYGRAYNIALKDQLKDRFSNDEIKTVLSIIGKLPKYRKL